MYKMKFYHFFLLVFIAFPTIVWSQDTWKVQGYQAIQCNKVLVLAKISDVIAKKQVEDYTVKFLTNLGVATIPGYSTIRDRSFDSREEFLAFVDSLGVDALLVYTIEDIEKTTELVPSVNVGFSVSGMWGGFLGASTPISGGPKVVTQIIGKGSFYVRNHDTEQWLIRLVGNLDESTSKLAYIFAKSTVKAMKKDKLFILGK